MNGVRRVGGGWRREQRAWSARLDHVRIEAGAIRALRALGSVDEALATGLTLRGRFPDHALAR